MVILPHLYKLCKTGNFYQGDKLVRFMGQILGYNEATKQKEDNLMKTAVINKMELPLAPYPNAATRREILHKVVDHLLIMAS